MKHVRTLLFDGRVLDNAYIVNYTSQQRRFLGKRCDARYSLRFGLNARSYRFLLPVLQEEGCAAWCPLVVAWVLQLANRKWCCCLAGTAGDCSGIRSGC